MTSFEVRDYADAHRNLEAALASPERPLDERQRRETAELLERTQQFLGYLRIEVSPDDAVVTINMEEPRFEEDGTVLMSVGGHTLQVAAEGYVTQTQRFSLNGGESRPVRVELQRVPPAVAPAPPPPDEGFPVVAVALAAAGAFAVMTGAGIGWYVNRSDELAKCEAAQANPDLDC
ncbi:MAG: hypothetical protein JRH11_04655, partial [Deltaproteobacteria bacterium]|nr:hypothetical protein [Deltaproteobacteria bacterium]